MTNVSSTGFDSQLWEVFPFTFRWPKGYYYVIYNCPFTGNYSFKVPYLHNGLSNQEAYE